MEIEKLSKNYTVRKLAEKDVDKIFLFYSKNELYFKHRPPLPTKESVREDMTALPPNKSIVDKFYIGYFDGENLVAVMDLIKDYPEEKTAYIGLFMIDVTIQNAGVGTKIISENIDFLRGLGFGKIELGYVKTNPQAKRFWHKNGFVEFKEIEQDDCVIVKMRKAL